MVVTVVSVVGGGGGAKQVVVLRAYSWGGVYFVVVARCMRVMELEGKSAVCKNIMIHSGSTAVIVWYTICITTL